MHPHPRLIAFIALLVFAVGCLGAPAPARASDEDCVQCKHVDCLRNTIKRKEAMATGYDALAQRFGVGWRDARGNARMEVDFSAYADDLARAGAYDELRRQQASLATAEEALSDSVGAAGGCPDATVSEAWTNAETCEMRNVDKAMADAPCKQIGELIASHEGIHQAACEARAGSKKVRLIDLVTRSYVRDFPSRMVTPAGRATEEARAYRMEAAALKPLLKKAEAKCKTSFKGVKTSCVIPTPVGAVSMGQKLAGEACGAPDSATWTIHSTGWTQAPGVGYRESNDPPWQTDCLLKGSAEETRRAGILNGAIANARGWMCIYDPGDERRKPTITIRNFRMPQCTPSGEQAITVEAERGECDGDDPQAPDAPDADVPVS